MAGRRTGGLGKGLDALIPNKAGGPSKEPAKKTRSAVVKKDKPTEKDSPAAERLVKISSVEPNLNQPRRHFDEDALLELSESIKQYGVLQPLLVSDKKDYFEIIAGERRWRAAKMAGLKEVPVVVKEFSTNRRNFLDREHSAGRPESYRGSDGIQTSDGRVSPETG